MAKKELILNKPNFSIFISTTQLSALQRKGLNLFLKTAEIELKTNKEVQELKKRKKELEEELESIEKEYKIDYLKKDDIEKELEIVNHKFRSKIASFYEFRVKVEDVIENTGTNNKNDEYIRDEMLKLKELSVEIRKDLKNWGGFVFFPKVEREGDYFIFKVIDDLKEQIVIGKGYTPLDLLEMKKLTGIYGIIFYEIMKMYDFRGNVKLEVEEVRKLTGTMNEYNKSNEKINFYNWENYVLKAGIDEINEKTLINITYDKIKYKREIKWIEFKISKKENFEDAEIKEEDKNISEEEIENNKSEYKETKKKIKYSEEIEELYNLLPQTEQLESRKEEFEKLLKEHSFEYLKSDIEYCKKKKPKEFWGYFIKSTKEGHYSTVDIEKEKKKEELKKEREQEESEFLRKQHQEEEEKRELVKYLFKDEIDAIEVKWNELPESVKKIHKMTNVTFDMFLEAEVFGNEILIQKLKKRKEAV